MRLYSSKHHCTVPVWGVPGQEGVVNIIAVLRSSAKRLVYPIMMRYKMQEFQEQLFSRTGMIVSMKFIKDKVM